VNGPKVPDVPKIPKRNPDSAHPEGILRGCGAILSDVRQDHRNVEKNVCLIRTAKKERR
jgi:hypothetical protein